MNSLAVEPQEARARHVTVSEEALTVDLASIIHEGTQGSLRGPQWAVGAPFEGTDKTAAS